MLMPRYRLRRSVGKADPLESHPGLFREISVEGKHMCKRGFPFYLCSVVKFSHEELQTLNFTVPD